MAKFPDLLPHGILEEVFPDIYFVTGQIRIKADQTHEFSRNMIVVRDGQDLILVNTMRLDEAGLAALESLGTVRNIVKLGGFHGRDDAFYLDRYAASLWAPQGMTYARGEQTDKQLNDGQSGPVAGSTAFVFNTPKMPEAILHLDRQGGVILTCDSFQNALGPDKYFNEVSAESKRRLGFFDRAVVGPGWRKFAEPRLEDLERVLDMEFNHLLSAHGEPLFDDAHAAVQTSIARLRG